MNLRTLFLCTITLFTYTGNRLIAKNNSSSHTTPIAPSSLPARIESGEQGPFHVQGIAVDLKRGHLYLSFTTTLLKMDLQGNLLGSVEGMTGHLGCLSFNAADGRVYGSIEYKNDAIGRGIRNTLHTDESKVTQKEQLPASRFYIAIFDTEKITRLGMNAETDSVMKAVYLPEVVKDYYDSVSTGGKRVAHRFGCSGIDGVGIGPAFGAAKESKPYLHVAYGIYGDTTRTDNDYQVLLAYDLRTLTRYARPLKQDEMHLCGPQKPLHKYFVPTGNTSYGIQNLAYDPATGDWYAAVYRGTKCTYPNYALFVIDGSKRATEQPLNGFDTPTRGEVLSLKEAGKEDPRSGIRGWDFRWGATGLCPLGKGYFYISHDGYNPANKQHSDTVCLYRWTGDPQTPFELIP